MKKSPQTSNLKLQRALFLILFAICGLRSMVIAESPATPARVFFSDAKMSFIFPEHWQLERSFPFGPLFQKQVQHGSPALISCAISQPLQDTHMSSDISKELLHQLADRELLNHEPGYQLIRQRDRDLAGHHAYEVTWKNQVSGEALEHQSIYFYVEDRIYALALQANETSFRWLEADFETWLNSLQILSRQDSGALAAPAHGGVWVHQTGGIKITLPSEWLIGIADDRTLGATIVSGDQHSEFTATLDLSPNSNREINRREKKELRKTITQDGDTILKESEDPFHDLPAFQVDYEGKKNDRLIHAHDILVAAPHARWLFSIEGDPSLYRHLKDQYDTILNNIQFL